MMHSRFSRLSTARGSGTSLITVGPAKVKACKSILFTEVALKNTCLMQLTHSILSHLYSWNKIWFYLTHKVDTKNSDDH